MRKVPPGIRTISSDTRVKTATSSLGSIATLFIIGSLSACLSHKPRSPQRLMQNGDLCTRKRQLDPPVLRPPLRGIVRSTRVRFAKPPRRDKVRIQALRDQILHDGVGALLRQPLVRGDALALQLRT